MANAKLSDRRVSHAQTTWAPTDIFQLTTAADSSKVMTLGNLFGLIPQAVFIGVATTTNSSDPAVNVHRHIDGAGSAAAHCFSDSSEVSRSGGAVAYNCFDARFTVTGAGNFDHFACFQNGMVMSSSGTTDNVYGFYDLVAISAGTITARHGLYVATAAISGTGAITSQYGVYVAALSGATNNYAIYTAGATPSYFEGAIGVGIAPVAAYSLYVGGAHNIGQWYPLRVAGTATGIIVGLDLRCATSGTGNAALIMGLQDNINHGSSGVCAERYGFYCAGTAAGNTTDRYGVFVADYAGAGTLTNQYGIYVAALAKGGTLNYAVYTAGATPSLFTGNVTVGGLTLPDTKDITIAGGAGTGSKIGQAGSKIGLYGVTPVTRQVLATGAGATVDNVISFLQTFGACKQA